MTLEANNRDIDYYSGALTVGQVRVYRTNHEDQQECLLLEHPGRVVTRQDIRGRLWPDTNVDFDHGLDVALSRLRSALGDSGRDPRVIETVPGVGYRIATSAETVAAAVTPPARTRYEWRRVLSWAVVAALVAAALTLVIVPSRYDRFVPRAVQGQP